MHGAAFVLVANIGSALLFAASFAIIALANPTQRSALWFSVSYAIGMITPLSEFLLPITPWPQFFTFLSYASFSAGLLSMSLALASFYRMPRPWRLVGLLYLASLLTRWAIWGGARNTFPYEQIYQTPFAIAALTAGWVMWKAGRARRMEIGLIALYAILASLFILKSWLAMIVGSGNSAQDYTASAYSLLSQSSTGIVLVAIGLMTLLLVAQEVIQDAQQAAVTDPLTGLLNRRGFDQKASQLLNQAVRTGEPVSVLMVDIDHFKRINDNYGHAMGDQVLRHFARLLLQALPQADALGRMGGEEFAILFGDLGLTGAAGFAERVRRAIGRTVILKLPTITVSVGVAAIAPGGSFGDAMRRADLALYQAKKTGRNKVCAARTTADGGDFDIIDIDLLDHAPPAGAEFSHQRLGSLS